MSGPTLRLPDPDVQFCRPLGSEVVLSVGETQLIAEPENIHDLE